MGGLAGHMLHIHESLELTFGDIADIIYRISNAEIQVTEKVDGLNLFVSVNEFGDLIAARNTTDIKNGGMTSVTYINKWKGHPAEFAFVDGFKAIQFAFNSLTNKQKNKIFNKGKRYINLEIIYPNHPNIIVYAQPTIVFHNAVDLIKSQEYSYDSFFDLVSILDKKNVFINNQNWLFSGPSKIKLLKFSDNKKIEKYIKDIQSIVNSSLGVLTMDSTLENYFRFYLTQDLLNKNFSLGKIEDIFLSLVDNSYLINPSKIKKGLTKEQSSYYSEFLTKTNSRKYISKALKKIEFVIHEFSVDILNNLQSNFVKDSEKESIRIKKELNKSIRFLDSLSNSGNIDAKNILDNQLKKISISKNSIPSIEGLVFEYPVGSGNIKKITGNFAPINQIIGKARRLGMENNLISEYKKSKSKINLKKFIIEQKMPSRNLTDIMLGLVPISAKPFHKGHMFLIEEASRENDEVIVYVSLKDRIKKGEFPIYGKDMEIIWENILKNIMPNNVIVEFVEIPVRSVYEKAGEYCEAELAGLELNTTLRIYSDKEDTLNNFQKEKREKYFEPLLSQGRVEFPGDFWQERNKTSIPTSGTLVRKFISNDDFESFEDSMPSHLKREQIKEIWNILTARA
jgi:cytidyltransferase-like protein